MWCSFHSTFKFFIAWNFKGKVNECYNGVSMLKYLIVYSCTDVTLLILLVDMHSYHVVN